jgi:hypothetical protein
MAMGETSMDFTDEQRAVLMQLLEGARTLTKYYSDHRQMTLQNSVNAAAGLKPVHDDYTIEWKRTQEAKTMNQAVVLAAMLGIEL